MLKINKTFRSYTKGFNVIIAGFSSSIADCHVVSRIALNLPRSEGSQILGSHDVRVPESFSMQARIEWRR